MLSALGAGAMLGLSVALPFGPVSLICVQRSIGNGLKYGLVAGAGATVAHGVFATAAMTGAHSIALELAHWSLPIRLCSAALLLTLGIRLLRRGPFTATPLAAPGRGAAFTSTLVLALSNPMTLLPYLAVVSSATATGTLAASVSAWSIPGVMAGAAVWYATLSGGAALLRGNLTSRMTRHLHLLAGGLLLCFAVALLPR